MTQLTEEAIDTLTAQVLRIHPEPFEYVTERAVHAALTADPAHYLTFLLVSSRYNSPPAEDLH